MQDHPCCSKENSWVSDPISFDPSGDHDRSTHEHSHFEDSPFASNFELGSSCNVDFASNTYSEDLSINYWPQNDGSFRPRRHSVSVQTIPDESMTATIANSVAPAGSVPLSQKTDPLLQQFSPSKKQIETTVYISEAEYRQHKERTRRNIRKLVAAIGISLTIICVLMVAVSLSFGNKLDELVAQRHAKNAHIFDNYNKASELATINSSLTVDMGLPSSNNYNMDSS